MLKQIPKSDITLRPFKVYKNFTATQLDSGSGFNTYTAYNHTGSFDVLTESQSLENGIWHQLYTMYYRDPHNLYTSYGTIKPTYSEIERVKQRILNNKAYVYTIPQIKFGEEIKPKSIVLKSELLDETILDDGFGNLSSNYNSYTFIRIDIENSLFIFEDPNGTELTANLISYEDGPAIDIENGIFQIEFQEIFYLIQIDVETSFISWLGVFDTNGVLQVSPVVIGNVFYSHGIITITRDVDTSRLDMIDYDWQLNYQSTNTIYENEILLVVDEDEFNTSTNPTAVNFTNLKNLEYTTSFEGTKRTSTYDAARIKNDYYTEHTFNSGSIVYGQPITESVTINGWGGFNHYEYSASIDPTGSFIAPYVTTIGLYDENMDMVAVAKLATPIKSTPDLPVNFLVRIDT